MTNITLDQAAVIAQFRAQCAAAGLLTQPVGSLTDEQLVRLLTFNKQLARPTHIVLLEIGRTVVDAGERLRLFVPDMESVTPIEWGDARYMVTVRLDNAR